MLYGWTILIDISVLVVHYKQNKWTSIIHGFLAFALIVTTFATSLPSLLKNGFNTKHLTHYVIGVVIWGIMFFEVILGVISLTMQWLNKGKSFSIYLMKKIHSYLGFALIILSKVQIFLMLK